MKPAYISFTINYIIALMSICFGGFLIYKSPTILEWIYIGTPELNIAGVFLVLIFIGIALVFAGLTLCFWGRQEFKLDRVEDQTFQTKYGSSLRLGDIFVALLSIAYAIGYIYQAFSMLFEERQSGLPPSNLSGLPIAAIIFMIIPLLFGIKILYKEWLRNKN